MKYSIGDTCEVVSGHDVKVSLDSVVIEPHKIEQIRAAMSQIKNEGIIFEEWGFGEIFEKGTAISFLFWGIPGTGKTLTAQAIADEIGGTLKIISTAEIQSSEPGGAERALKLIFETAIQNNKAGKHQVLLFDECDSLLTARDEVGPILGAQVNALLTEIERYEGIIIFTTNRMGKLDPALERRIAAKIEFIFPNHNQRKLIWERMIPKKAPIAKDVDFEKLSEYPLAGGNIKNAMLNAARTAAYNQSPDIKMSHFVEAIEKESASISAFVSEYEQQTHIAERGYIANTGSELSVQRKMVDKMKVTESLDTILKKRKKNG